MNNTFLKFAAVIFIAATTFAACKKVDNETAPVPEEQELITTVKLVLTDGSGNAKTYAYKVENGFGDNPGTISVDTLLLEPNKAYDAQVQVLNEKANPAEEITEEVMTENEDHLFVFESTPASGDGSVAMSDGSKDAAGKAFNQKIKLTAASAGKGSLTVTLKHLPTNKAATTASAAGGETDAEAIFPVRIQ
jgi:hypothetical protein